MSRILSAIILIYMVIFCVNPSFATLYNYNGTFESFTAPDTSMFDGLENKPFWGQFDLDNRYFSFETDGYSYGAGEIQNWLYFSPMSLISMSSSIYFDVRDIAESPTTLWIKSGTDMIGGTVSASPVPVPGAILLLGSGLLGAAGIRIRSKKARR